MGSILGQLLNRIRDSADGYGKAVMFGIAVCLVALAVTVAVAATS